MRLISLDVTTGATMNRRRGSRQHLRILWLLTFLIGSLSVSAQGRPALDVVSIRESRNVGVNFAPKGLEFQPNRLVVTNMTVEELVRFAYAIRPGLLRQLVLGWPNTGIKAKGFDITATLTDAASPIQIAEQRRIVREVLVSRFGLKAHAELRTIGAYRLVPVKPGALGPKLRRVDYDCSQLKLDDVPKDKNGHSLCQHTELRNGGHGVFHRRSGDISKLIAWLDGFDGRRIVDATGLNGFYVWELEYGQIVGPLETAIREQLGLRLEPAQVQADAVVIDDVRMPIPN
jgi:uncharacterized protein (TIGR03435 family)